MIHAFCLPEFVVSFTITSREVSELLDGYLLLDDGSTVRIPNASDYSQLGTLTGTLPRTNRSYSVPYYGLTTPGLSWTGGDYMTNGDRGRDYMGYSLSFTKRLANKWMARGFIPVRRHHVPRTELLLRARE